MFSTAFLLVQLVLEVLESNVKRGSKVYETGHVLVLGWVDNRRDEEVMWKILSQVCDLTRHTSISILHWYWTFIGMAASMSNMLTICHGSRPGSCGPGMCM